ncbi:MULTISPECIES: hypothetical protein [unclassified Microbulbifer]|uniref:Uncharacterized protein n=1 Tax=Microbulbifer spongiae TaxID=2944933 RepID=A0ABY9EF39_9GAMM|nr:MULTISPECIES: hypothetical protein [unclassified Microbulbifer]MDP5210015.1 hypothetical protein [Microbulbifer sp. 2205BS26-8]WKD51100.1 hypothetical protein M8T91_06665 [Microbulbifer sp. MI-G]WKD51709.1 hypothetical protein M8T91_18530 [Microbulbifer sp. MI-G]
MDDSDERIAADILIASLQRGGGNSSHWPSGDMIEDDAEKLANAFQVIYDAVRNAHKN